MVTRQTFHGESWRPDWRIDDAPLVSIDLETTGLYPERDQRIVEIAAIDDGGVRFHRRVDPEEQKPGFGGGEERRILFEVCRLLDSVVTVGHNVLFDIHFLAERCRRHQIPLPTTGVIDTLGLARRFLGDETENNLESVATELDIAIPEELHRAIPDARLARAVLDKFVDIQGLETLADAEVRRVSLHDH